MLCIAAESSLGKISGQSRIQVLLYMFLPIAIYRQDPVNERFQIRDREFIIPVAQRISC